MGGHRPEIVMHAQEILEDSDAEGLKNARSCEGEDAVMSWQCGAKSAGQGVGSTGSCYQLA